MSWAWPYTDKCIKLLYCKEYIYIYLYTVLLRVRFSLQFFKCLSTKMMIWKCRTAGEVFSSSVGNKMFLLQQAFLSQHSNRLFLYEPFDPVGDPLRHASICTGTERCIHISGYMPYTQN